MAFLLSAADGIKSQFEVKEVNSTNTVFSLFSKVTFGLCIFASVIVVTTEYVGNPINCDLGEASVVSSDVFNAHCWIHGTKHVPEKFQQHVDCIARKPNPISGKDEQKNDKIQVRLNLMELTKMSLFSTNGWFSCWL